MSVALILLTGPKKESSKSVDSSQSETVYKKQKAELVFKPLSKTDALHDKTITQYSELALKANRLTEQLAQLREADGSLQSVEKLDRLQLDARRVSGDLKKLQKRYTKTYQDKLPLLRHRTVDFEHNKQHRRQLLNDLQQSLQPIELPHYTVHTYNERTPLPKRAQPLSIHIKTLSGGGHSVRVFDADPNHFEPYKKAALAHAEVANTLLSLIHPESVNDQTDGSDDTESVLRDEPLPNALLSMIGHDQAEALQHTHTQRRAQRITLRNQLDAMDARLKQEKNRLYGTRLHTEKWNPSLLEAPIQQLANFTSDAALLRQVLVSEVSNQTQINGTASAAAVIDQLEAQRHSSRINDQLLNLDALSEDHRSAELQTLIDFANKMPEASPVFLERLVRLDKQFEQSAQITSVPLTQTEYIMLNYNARLLHNQYGDELRAMIDNSFRHIVYDTVQQQIVVKNKMAVKLGSAAIVPDLLPRPLNPLSSIQPPTLSQMEPFELGSAKKNRRKSSNKQSMHADHVARLCDSIRQNIQAIKSACENKRHIDIPTFSGSIRSSLETLKKGARSNLTTAEGKQWIADYHLILRLQQARSGLQANLQRRKQVCDLIPVVQSELVQAQMRAVALREQISVSRQDNNDLSTQLANTNISNAELQLLHNLETFYGGSLANISATPATLLQLGDMLLRPGVDSLLAMRFPATQQAASDNLAICASLSDQIMHLPYDRAVQYANAPLPALNDVMPIMPPPHAAVMPTFDSADQLESVPFSTVDNALNVDNLMPTHADNPVAESFPLIPSVAQVTPLLQKLEAGQLTHEERDQLSDYLINCSQANRLELCYEACDQAKLAHQWVRDLINISCYVRPEGEASIMPRTDAEQTTLVLTGEEKKALLSFDISDVSNLFARCESNSQMVALKALLARDFPDYDDEKIRHILNITDPRISLENQNIAISHLRSGA